MKYGVLITARLKSTRLHKKVIKKINKYNIIEFLINRLKTKFDSRKIVIITSNSNQDKILEKIAFRENIKIFKGEPKDVLLRMYKAAKKFKFKNFISCTADNPFTDPDFAIKLMKYHIKNKNDLSLMKKVPLGTFSYAINFNGIKKSIKYKNSNNTENWGGYFINNKKLKVGYFDPKFNYMNVSKKIRLTVDFPKDLKLIKAILRKSKKDQPTLKEIMKILKTNSNMVKINLGIKQKKETKPIFKNLI